MRLWAINIIFLAALCGCQGYFASLDAPKNSLITASESPMALALSKLADQISRKPFANKDVGLDKVASSAKAMLGNIEKLDLTSNDALAPDLLEYLKNLALFLSQVERWPSALDIKNELANYSKELTLAILRIDEILNPPSEEQSTTKALLRKNHNELLGSIKKLTSEEQSFQYVDTSPGYLLINQLNNARQLKLKNSQDLLIYADYLKIKNYSVFIVDVKAILNEAQKMSLDEPQTNEWLLGIIEKEALKKTSPVVILLNSADIKKDLNKIKVPVLYSSTEDDALSLPFSLMMAEDLIDQTSLPDKDLIKGLIKIAKALDSDGLSIGMIDDLSHKFVSESQGKNPKQKKNLQKVLLKNSFSSSEDLINFIDSFSPSAVEQKLLSDKLWFHKNQQQGLFNFEQQLTRIAEGRAKISFFDGRLAKDNADLARIEADKASKLASTALSEAENARLLQEKELTDIDNNNLAMNKLHKTRKSDNELILSKFQSQVSSLVADILSGIDKDTLKNRSELKAILDEKLRQINNQPQVISLKELLDKEITKLDSRISTADTFHKILTHEVTGAVSSLLFKTGMGYLTGGTEGALKAAAKTATEIITSQIAKFLK